MQGILQVDACQRDTSRIERFLTCPRLCRFDSSADVTDAPLGDAPLWSAPESRKQELFATDVPLPGEPTARMLVLRPSWSTFWHAQPIIKLNSTAASPKAPGPGDTVVSPRVINDRPAPRHRPLIPVATPSRHGRATPPAEVMHACRKDTEELAQIAQEESPWWCFTERPQHRRGASR